MLTKSQVKELQRSVDATEGRLPNVFNALSDTGRYRIFKLLLAREGLCVTDVAHVFDISVPAASQQLKILELSGLVSKNRAGQMICYTLKKEDSLVKTLIKIISSQQH